MQRARTTSLNSGPSLREADQSVSGLLRQPLQCAPTVRGSMVQRDAAGSPRVSLGFLTSFLPPRLGVRGLKKLIQVEILAVTERQASRLLICVGS
jgi:hypothetical protein